jgi:hypothetical protein
MQFLTADQKQQCVSVCEKLHHIASDDSIFLSRVIGDDESYDYGYDYGQGKATIFSMEIEEQSQEGSHHFLRHQGDCS